MHVQTVQYIQPQHHSRLAQAELLVIDEAAAIPLPLVRAMLGPYLVFLCSTVNGYEGVLRAHMLEDLLSSSAAFNHFDPHGRVLASSKSLRSLYMRILVKTLYV